MKKSYTLDLSDYTEDDILFVAQYYGYGEFSNAESTPMEYIEQSFKAMADNWFARPMVQRATQELESHKAEITNGVYSKITNETTIQ